MVKVVRKTVPSSGSSITETALAELGSAPRLDVLVYKYLHGLTAPYLTDDCWPYLTDGWRRNAVVSALPSINVVNRHWAR